MNNQEILLTIIIPHYNSPELLGKLLKTIPENPNIQTIVIDDASNYNLEELNKVIEKNHEKIEFKINKTALKGAGVCRNIGLKNALGKWLLFADADDYFVEGFYEKVKQYFDSSYDIIFFSPQSEYLDSGENSDRHLTYKKYIKNYIEMPTREHLLELKSSTGNPPWSKLIRHDLVKKNKIFFSEILYANDIMFSSKIGFFSKKVWATEEEIYCVTKNKGSLTTHTDINSFDIRLNEYINVCNFLRTHYDKEECEYLHIAGIGLILTAIERKYGISKIVSIYKALYENKIPLIRKKSRSMKYLIKQLNKRKQKNKNDKTYNV